MYVYGCFACICIFVLYAYSTFRDQKRLSDILELELQLWATMLMLGTETEFSAKAASALNH